MTQEQARLATKAIKVEYELLPAVTDVVAALQPDAPKLHDPKDGNVIEDVRVVHGDPDAKADVVVEGEYEVAMQDQAALGPEAGLAIPGQDGGVTLHIATQWLHEDLRQIAPCLGLPEEKVRLVLAGVGGAFGAREDVTLQIHVCLLALATKRAVRMTYGREESFYGHVHRHPARMWYQHGATRDGDLVFVRARSCSTAARTRRPHSPSSRTPRASERGRTAFRTRSSMPSARTRTIRRPARCAGSARSSRASRTRRRWTSSPLRWEWIRSSCARGTRSRTATAS